MLFSRGEGLLVWFKTMALTSNRNFRSSAMDKHEGEAAAGEQATKAMY